MLVAATACWGAGTVATKQVLDDVDPLTLLPMQLAASCLFLLAACALGRTKITWTSDTKRLTALGILNPGLAYALGLLGLASITASMSVLLWAAEPVLILLLAAALLREHIPAALAAGLGVSVVGVVLVVYQPGAAGAARGIALTLAAVTACALYSVLTRRLLVDDASLPVVLFQQGAALGFALVVAAGAGLAGWQEWWPTEMSPRIAVAASVSGILYYGAAFWFYLAGLRQVPASVAGSFLPLIPVFGVAASLVVGERLDGAQWVGAALVIGGTLVVALRAR
jgi:drug/metabolite transporter (DMT)-like permease